jgi:PTH1 family peptidyl-tRNA hydrolase
LLRPVQLTRQALKYGENIEDAWLVVGLGNPGKRYAATPHNAGFAVADLLGDRLGCRLKRSWRFRAKLGNGRIEGTRLLLVKPLTFMNISGEAVAPIMRYYRLAQERLIVVADDADLPLGVVRVKAKGGSGGHRGLDSVIMHLDSQGFIRIRLGIGRDSRGADLVDHVLSPLEGEEHKLFSEEVKQAVEAVQSCVLEGVDKTMNTFNSRRASSEHLTTLEGRE